jgi:hypothetical protein
MKSKNFKKINKYKDKFKQKKFFGAVALTMLVFAGGVLAVPTTEDDSLNNFSSCGNFNAISSHADEIIKTENLSLPENFDYIHELNKEFVKNTSYEEFLLNDDTSNESVKKECYRVGNKFLRTSQDVHTTEEAIE